jgi:hypothetical protein
MDAIELVGGGGQKKRVERFVVYHCWQCDAHLGCPNDTEPWSWLNSGPGRVFATEHSGHRNLVPEILIIEKE